MSLLASVLRRYLRVNCPDKKFHYICKPRASHYGSCVNSIDLGESVTSKRPCVLFRPGVQTQAIRYPYRRLCN